MRERSKCSSQFQPENLQFHQTKGTIQAEKYSYLLCEWDSITRDIFLGYPYFQTHCTTDVSCGYFQMLYALTLPGINIPWYEVKNLSFEFMNSESSSKTNLINHVNSHYGRNSLNQGWVAPWSSDELRRRSCTNSSRSSATRMECLSSFAPSLPSLTPQDL